MGSEADILDYPDLHYSFFPLLALAQPTPRILRKTPNRQYLSSSTRAAPEAFKCYPISPLNFSCPSSSFIALLIAQYFVLSINFTRILQRLYHVVIQCTLSNLILSSCSSVGLTILQYRAPHPCPTPHQPS